MRTQVARILWLAALGVALSACDAGDEGEAPEEAVEEQVEETPTHDAQGRPYCGDGVEGACVDEWGAHLCGIDTGWPGDELALCERDEGDGFIMHYGPKDYDDPEEIAKYTLEAGGEDENCVYIQTPNTEDIYVDQFHGRMRPGSHHLIVTIVDDAGPDLVLNEPIPCNQADAVGLRWLLGSQDPKIDVAAGGGGSKLAAAVEGDPDFGAATMIPANAILRIDMHYLNSSDREILRESWISVNEVPKEDVEVQIDMITWYQGAISVPPQSTGVETGIARCRVPSDRYLGLVTGHFHENGTRFTVWHEPQGGDQVKIYETFDWEDPGNAAYADRYENPQMGDPASDWGAESGYIHVKAGDVVSFQCEFDNPTDTTVNLGDTGSDQMCNVFGFYYPSDGDVWNCACVGALCL